MSKIKQFAKAHKFITLIVLIAVVWGAYAAYGAVTAAPTVTRYVVQAATQGTVVASVSGSGQVEAQTTVDVKPQVSENVTKIYVQPGDHVTAGQLLVQLDTTNEAKAVTQAQLSLQSAQIALEKLEQISTTTLLQNQGSVTTSEQDLENASTSLAKDYQSGFDTIASTFIDFQNVMTNLQGFTGGTQVDKLHDNPDAYVDLMPAYLQPAAQPYAAAVQAEYQGALAAYQQNLTDYHAATRNSPPASLDALFAETQDTAKTISAAVKSVNDLLNYITNNYPTSQGIGTLPSITATYQTNFGTYTNTVNGDLSNVTNVINTITGDEQALTNAEQNLAQASETLDELVGGPNPLDVQSQQISIQNAQLSLQTAQQNLAYDSIRSPIDGIVSSVPSVVGVAVPSPAASVVSSGQLAQVTLNEVDAAKVQVGDKATLTFDAIPDLSLAGTVTEIDPVGTVSAGVVNYNVQINFMQAADTSSSEQVKPGMSVTANIVTQVDQNVVTVPSSAVHTVSGSSYVLEPVGPLPAAELASSTQGGVLLPGGTKMVPVTTGITGGTEVEIASGVNVGDQVVTQTVAGGASGGSAAASAGGTSALRSLGAGAGGFGGLGGAGGGAVRIGGGGAAGAARGG